MKPYPRLCLCPRCRRHAIIFLNEYTKSMGFMTKQTGFSIIMNMYEQQKIDADEYRKLYEDISNSPLTLRGDPCNARDEITLMRLVFIHAESLKGARLLEPYFACGEDDPILIRRNLSETVKANLN